MRLTSAIPMAVLAGIALNGSSDVLNWSFLKRSHKVSWKGFFIMCGVLFLTVFVDLIVAVEVGIFIANILTIERLSELQSQDAKVISDTDDTVVLSAEEKQPIDRAHGRVLLFYLSEPMIFEVSKAIARQHNAAKDCDVVVMDLSDTPHLDITASLDIENAIRDAVDKGRQVHLVGAAGRVESRLGKLGIFQLVPSHHLFTDQSEALRQAALTASTSSSESMSDPNISWQSAAQTL